MCLICGEGDGYLDNGDKCWGCNFTHCPGCGIAVIVEGLCDDCLVSSLRGLINIKECQRTKPVPYLRRVK